MTQMTTIFFMKSLSARSTQRSASASSFLQCETKVKFQLDCGATVNILPVDEYKQAMNDPALNRLTQTNKTLQMFNKTQLKSLGVAKIETVNPKNDDSLKLEFVVVKEGHTAILSAQAIQQFQLMTVNSDNIIDTFSFAYFSANGKRQTANL